MSYVSFANVSTFKKLDWYGYGRDHLKYLLPSQLSFYFPQIISLATCVGIRTCCFAMSFDFFFMENMSLISLRIYSFLVVGEESTEAKKWRNLKKKWWMLFM